MKRNASLGVLLSTQIYQSILIFSLAVLFLGELSGLFFFPYPLRWSFDFLGLILDLGLSVYVMVKIVQTSRYNVFNRYLRSDLWIDIAHSLIPLFLYSIPLFFLSLSGTEVGAENSSWLSLYFYQAKFLRLLRFSVLSFTFLPDITQNNKSLISIERIFLLCFFVPFGLFIFLGFGNSQIQGKNPFFETYLREISLPEPSTKSETLERDYPFILAIQDNSNPEGSMLYARNLGWQSYYGVFDYFVINKGFSSFYIDESPLVRERAQMGLFFFFFNFAIFLSLFRLNSFLLKNFIEPTNIILKGLTDPLEIRRVDIPDNYREDPTFRLAREYNSQILSRKLTESPKSRIPFVPKELKGIFPDSHQIKHE